MSVMLYVLLNNTYMRWQGREVLGGSHVEDDSFQMIDEQYTILLYINMG